MVSLGLGLVVHVENELFCVYVEFIKINMVSWVGTTSYVCIFCLDTT